MRSIRVFNGACFSGILLIAVSAVGATVEQPLLADGPVHSIWKLLFHCSLFGLLGIALVVIGFKVFDWVITKIDLEAEILKGNVAAAILSAAAIMGVSLIVALAIH